MRPTDISGSGSGRDEWDEPTRNDSTHDTAPHDLIGLARISAVREPGDVLRLAYGEGQEDAIRALYAVLRTARRPPLTTGEQDAIVLAVRQRLTRL